MKKLINLAIHRRGLMFVVFCFIAVIGYYSWDQLAIDAYPDIADVTVQVVTQVPGLAAEEIEQQISIPIERTLNGLPGMTVMRSRNSFGISTITLVFEDGVDDYWARQRVQERLGDVELPYNAIPGLNPLTSATGEIFRYVLESKNHDLRELTDLNKWVVIPRLKQVTGVADVSNFGGITTQYQIEVDPHKMEQYNISLSDIKDKIEKNNINAGGSILNRGDLSYVIRGIGLVKDLNDLGQVVLKSENGVPVYLNDVGKLKYGNLERKGVLGYCDKKINLTDGVEGIVQMLRFQNPSSVLKDVHLAVNELNSSILPKGVTIHPFVDRTNLVETTLHTVSHTLLEGMILVVLVLIVFLGNWRGALLVALTIPLSLLIAFILMHVTGIPANLLSLGAIDFGILVDGAIVMMETILKKRESNPLVPLQEESIMKRAFEVAKPILFSTLIIITAYLPLFTFQHIEKKLFTPMAYTVGYALLGALAVSFFLIPGLAFMAYRKPSKIYKNKWLEKLSDIYHRQTVNILKKPKRVLAPLAVILLLAGVFSYTVGKDFLPPLDEGSIWVQMQLPPGISIDRSKQMAEDFRKTIMKFDEVSYVMTQVGRDDAGTDAFSLSHVECSVGLKPYDTWKNGKKKADLIEEMSAALKKMPGYTVGFSQPIIDMVMDQVAGAHSDLAVKIYGENLADTRRVSEQVEKTLKGIKGAEDVTIDEEPPLPQLQIIADRDRIAQYGLNISDVTDLIEMAIGGTSVSQIFVGSKSYDVTCRFNEESRSTPEEIGNLMLTTDSGVKIPLSQVAQIKMTTGASTITREMNKRHLTVRVNLRGVDLTSFLQEANRQIDKNVEYNKQNIHIKWGGQFENQQRAYSRLAVVIPLALGIMLLLLFGAFGKFRQAVLQMSVIPLAVFGGMLALNLRGMTLNVSSAVGFIALVGVAIQNGVIMVSHINNLRKDGKDLYEAVVTGTRHRFRPVLMTATVAVLGLLPASFSTGIGSDVQRPLATVIVYGLLFSTVITLYVLPALYFMIENHQLKLERKRVQEEEEQQKLYESNQDKV
ncbi:CusA/CzcA family heavy metal efflux RND transporter [uncultured Bacteroides sp.]|uniref:efflux RND transporter permease subunit n=1 Tax=uncultured Bacteroides sp. TaxID=162156 RepID=UPI002AA697DF|nr:CusA/CzcA family heavy metal efflux RND transporter [uncultured Bacteroides sp.]